MVKIKIFLIGLYIKLATKLPNNLYCFFYNVYSLIFRLNTKFYYDHKRNLFFAKSPTQKRFFHEKLQNFNTYAKGITNRGISLGETYFLDKIDFHDNDVVIDCGANVGDLSIFFDEIGVSVEYIVIEPSPKENECLKINCSNSQIYDYALWDSNQFKDFYLSTQNADSSVFKIADYSSKVEVKCVRLDSLIRDTRIKLFKLEAEGAELEVIKGSKKLLNNIEYISADLGYEKGINQDTTFFKVSDYLIKNGFSLIEINLDRLTCLFRSHALD